MTKWQNISVKSNTQLLKQLKEIDISVPKDRKDRKNIHIERWIFFQLLATLAESNELNFPLKIEKGESPDFVIINKEKIVEGIEITEAINPDYLKTESLPEAKNNYSGLERSLFKWKKRRKLKELREIATRTELSGPPWMGNSVEREYVEIVVDVTNTKTKTLNKNTFKKFKTNTLLIYINQSLPGLGDESSAELCFEALKQYWKNGSFDKIYVEVYSSIVCYWKEGYKVYDFSELWSN